MFSVVFEVQPKADQWDAYLDNASMLRPDLERIDGFIDNIRYRSLTREGWILSLSSWQDEKSLVRWRTEVSHHNAQARGRSEILQNYRLRVGQVTADNRLPEGHKLLEQRLDETEAGEGTTITLIDATRPEVWTETSNSADCAQFLGLNPYADGLVGWDVFDAVLTRGQLILMISWRDNAAAEAFDNDLTVPDEFRVRRIRVVRDYGMFDRREAPQYYPDARGAVTIHS